MSELWRGKVWWYRAPLVPILVWILWRHLGAGLHVLKLMASSAESAQLAPPDEGARFLNHLARGDGHDES